MGRHRVTRHPVTSFRHSFAHRVAAALVALVLPAAAAAHVVFAEPRPRAGSYYAGFLRVSHGCGDSPTVSVRVEIPSGIVTARPQPKPGWSLSVEHAPLADPIRAEGGAIVSDRVSAISWTGQLPPDQFDQFGIMMKLPAAAGPLFFPTTQRCANGVNAWVNIPASPDAWHETREPAPMLVLLPAEHGDMKH